MSLSVASIVSVVIFIVVAFSCYRNGLYSTLVTLFIVVLSAAAAMMCLGPMPRMMFVSRMGWYAPPICFFGVFLLGLVILQTVANYLFPPKLTLPKAVDVLGGSLLGLVTALFTTGVLMVAFALFPGTGGPEDKVVFLKADACFVRSMAWLSRWTGSTPLDADEFLRRVWKEKRIYQPKERPLERIYEENYQCAQRLAWLGQALAAYVDANRKYPRDVKELVPYLPNLGPRVKHEDVCACPATNLPYRIFSVTQESLVDDRFILIFDRLDGPYGHMGDCSGKRSVYLKNRRVEWLNEERFRGLYEGQMEAMKGADDTKGR